MVDRKLIDYLSNFLTASRLSQIERVLDFRTRYLTVVLEDIYQPHNASAVLRSSDCFGIQDVHVIENRNTYNVNPDVALGSSKWLNIIKYTQDDNNTLTCVKKLKKDGYRIIATSPHRNDIELQDFDISKGKSALFFGTELTGLSDEMMQHADEFLRIPMYGFTESFNISVSAAMVLYQLSLKLRASDTQWKLSDLEKAELKYEWMKQSIKKPELIIKDYFNKRVNK